MAHLPPGWNRPYLQDIVGDIDERTFTNVMAFGLDELHELRTLDPEGCGSRLYELASGLDRSKVTRVLRHIREAIDRLDSNDAAISPVESLGSHVHLFSPDGRLVSFTYEDALLDAQPTCASPTHTSPSGNRLEKNLRGIGVSVCGRPVAVPAGHPRQLTHAPWSIASCFTWSSDGRRIACVVDLPE